MGLQSSMLEPAVCLLTPRPVAELIALGGITFFCFWLRPTVRMGAVNSRAQGPIGPNRVPKDPIGPMGPNRTID